MSRSIARTAALSLLLLTGAGCSPSATPASAKTAAAVGALLPVTIQTTRGKRVFQVEIARTPAEQARGLMFRTSLAKNRGMIFPFDPPRQSAFWMKNTYIPLDMIFIRPDGTIAQIAANATPGSLEPIGPPDSVAAVLEIAGGEASASGISESDRVSWPGGPH